MLVDTREHQAMLVRITSQAHLKCKRCGSEARPESEKGCPGVRCTWKAEKVPVDE